MKRFLVVATLVVASVAVAKLTGIGGTLTSTSGAQAVVVAPAASVPGSGLRFCARCDAPAMAQSGTVTFYSDAGMTLYSDAGVVGVYAGSGDVYIYPNVPPICWQPLAGENAIAVAGVDSGTAHCWTSQNRER